MLNVQSAETRREFENYQNFVADTKPPTNFSPPHYGGARSPVTMTTSASVGDNSGLVTMSQLGEWRIFLHLRIALNFSLCKQKLLSEGKYS